MPRSDILPSLGGGGGKEERTKQTNKQKKNKPQKSNSLYIGYMHLTQMNKIHSLVLVYQPQLQSFQIYLNETKCS